MPERFQSAVHAMVHVSAAGIKAHSAPFGENWNVSGADAGSAWADSRRWPPARPSAARSWPPGSSTRRLIVVPDGADAKVAPAVAASEESPNLSTRTRA